MEKMPEVIDYSTELQAKALAETGQAKTASGIKHKEEGQGLVEYALILMLVAIVVIAILILLGPQIGSMFSGVTKGVS
jgi:pilus assembly protein Flp/PilA